MSSMLTVLAGVLAILALVGAAAAGSWRARRAAAVELRALRARVRELSARLTSMERSAAGSGRVGGAEPVLRPQARGEEPDASQPPRGPRTVH